MLGTAPLLGAALASWIPERIDRWIAAAVGSAAIAYASLVAVRPEWVGRPRPEHRALVELARSDFRPGERAVVANCSPLGPWIASHLFAFHWRAETAECGTAAPYRFDGARLVRQGESTSPR